MCFNAIPQIATPTDRHKPANRINSFLSIRLNLIDYSYPPIIINPNNRWVVLPTIGVLMFSVLS